MAAVVKRRYRRGGMKIDVEAIVRFTWCSAWQCIKAVHSSFHEGNEKSLVGKEKQRAVLTIR